jgi:hypothetical protein
MKRWWIGGLTLAVLAATLWVLGCGGSAKTDTAESQDAAAGGTAESQAGETQETPAAGEGSAATGTTAEGVSAAPGQIPVPAEGTIEHASLSGKLGCGHCTFHVKDSCTLAMKTDDGAVYIVDAGPRQEELFKVRYDEPAVLVAGHIEDVDGVKLIHAESVELR